MGARLSQESLSNAEMGKLSRLEILGVVDELRSAVFDLVMCSSSPGSADGLEDTYRKRLFFGSLFCGRSK